MKNKEKYIDLIIECVANSNNCQFARRIIKINCNITSCSECHNRVKQWLEAEYEEPKIDWSKVPINTPVIVWNNEMFKYNRYFAGLSEDGSILTFINGGTKWSSEDVKCAWNNVELANEKDIEKYAK